MDQSTLTDAHVVRAVLGGRTEAFAVLVRRYQDVLFAHAFRMMGARDEAADLVQKSLVRGFRRLSSCREPERVGGWLFRILANRCRTLLAKRARHSTVIQYGDLPDRIGATTDAERDWTEEVYKVLDTLPPEQKEAFLLRHVEDMAYEDIAAITGVGLSALRMRVKRACDTLRVRLTEMMRDD